MKIYIDGELHDEANAKISVFDHGLLYGDGVFEGIRFYNGRVFKLEEHMDRLYDSAKAILLTIPMSKADLTQALIDTVRANEERDGYIRLVVTRGVGDLGLNPNLCPKGSIIIISAKIKLYPEELYQRGLDIITCATRRVSQAAVPPAVKSLNYLNNIMAKIEALQANAAEALMLNEQGYIAECTADNFFVIKGGTLFTPPVSAGRPARHHARHDPRSRGRNGHPRQGNRTDPLRRVRSRRVFPNGHRRGDGRRRQNRLARDRRRQAGTVHAGAPGRVPRFDAQHRHADIRGHARHRACYARSGAGRRRRDFADGYRRPPLTDGARAIIFSRGNPHAM